MSVAILNDLLLWVKKHLDLFGRLFISLLCGLLTKLIIFVTQQTHPAIPIDNKVGLSISILVALISFFILLELKRITKSFELLNESIGQLQQEINCKVDTALLIDKINMNYHKIISHSYDPIVNDHLKNVLFNDHEHKGLMKVLEEIGGKREALITTKKDFWRVLIERLAYSDHHSIEKNKYVLSLETYCKLIIDSIKIGQKLAIQNGNTLVVISFTNVTPAVWFSGRDVIGKDLECYAERMSGLVNEMRNNGHIFRRCVLSKSDDFINDKDTMNGFSLFSTIVKEWSGIRQEQRNSYLNSYHTDTALADILNLAIPGLKFHNNCTEFVYIGFKPSHELLDSTSCNEIKEISDVIWDWCFCGGYTKNNLNMSASFIDFTSNTGEDLAINIPNKHHILDATSFDSKDLKIPFSKLPEFLLTNNTHINTPIKPTQFNDL